MSVHGGSRQPRKLGGAKPKQNPWRSFWRSHRCASLREVRELQSNSSLYRRQRSLRTRHGENKERRAPVTRFQRATRNNTCRDLPHEPNVRASKLLLLNDVWTNRYPRFRPSKDKDCVLANRGARLDLPCQRSKNCARSYLL
jgi:hypothetical protein